VIGDVDHHWDVLTNEPVPADVWDAIIRTTIYLDQTFPDLLQEVVRAQTDWPGAHGDAMRGAMLDWIRSLADAERTRATNFLRTSYGGNLPEWASSPAA
jgi:hypothetical protein